MPSYTDEQIRSEVHSGRDKERRDQIDALVARARAGDASALQKLKYMSGLFGDDPSTAGPEGWATMDAKNYNRMALRDLGIGGLEYGEQHDGGGFGRVLGDVLRIGAPLAGMVIPGVGMLGAGLIGAAGSAAGHAVRGDRFNLLRTLMSGAGAAAGNRLLGNGLGGGSSGLLGSSGGGGGAAAAAAGGGGGGGGGGVGNALLRGMGLGGGGGFDPMRLLGIGGAVLGGVDAHNQANRANSAMEQARGLATQAYEGRRPLGDAANASLLRGMGGLGQGWTPQPSEADELAKQRMRAMSGQAMPTNPAAGFTPRVAALSRAM